MEPEEFAEKLYELYQIWLSVSPEKDDVIMFIRKVEELTEDWE